MPSLGDHSIGSKSAVYFSSMLRKARKISATILNFNLLITNTLEIHHLSFIIHHYLRIFLFCLCWLNSSWLSSQPTDSLFVQLEQQLQRGENRALRDIATFLETPQLTDRAQRLLQNYTLLTTEEWNWAYAVDREAGNAENKNLIKTGHRVI